MPTQEQLDSMRNAPRQPSSSVQREERRSIGAGLYVTDLYENGRKVGTEPYAPPAPTDESNDVAGYTSGQGYETPSTYTYSAGSGGGGGGIPDGYVETAVILCENGTPVNGQILFKRD